VTGYVDLRWKGEKKKPHEGIEERKHRTGGQQPRLTKLLARPKRVSPIVGKGTSSRTGGRHHRETIRGAEWEAVRAKKGKKVETLVAGGKSSTSGQLLVGLSGRRTQEKRQKKRGRRGGTFASCKVDHILRRCRYTLNSATHRWVAARQGFDQWGQQKVRQKKETKRDPGHKAGVQATAHALRRGDFGEETASSRACYLKGNPESPILVHFMCALR